MLRDSDTCYRIPRNLQQPCKGRSVTIGDPTLADAILDRLVHSAHKIRLEGETMRKPAPVERQNAASKSKKN